MNHAQLLDAIAADRGRFDNAVDGLDAATLKSARMCGEWTATDLAGHLLDWQTELLAAARHALGGPAPAGHPIKDGQAFNTDRAAARSGAGWPATKAALDASLDEAAELARQLTVAQFDAPATPPWGGSATVGELLAVVPEHLDEHCAYIETWRREAPPAG